jgi:hydroxyacylglutathione hydrolase
MPTTSETALAYFDALVRRDPDGLAACWRPGSVDRMVGETELDAPDGVREYFTELFRAIPDIAFEVISATTEDDRCAVRWRAVGTFAGPGRLQGLEATGSRITLEGCDVVRVADGLVVGNDAYVNGMDVARQIGVLPPGGSKAEERMTTLFNRRTAVARRLAAAEPERVADGVWVLRGFVPRSMNVFLIEGDDGVTIYDGGIKAMTTNVARAAARLGPITRVVLGHGHPDHRGIAPGIDAPVYLHADGRAEAEGDGGRSYFDFAELERLRARVLMPRLLDWWDGGPVFVAGTLREGDEVAGFDVIHTPGHSPGLIALWRESDRLALVSDLVYTLDPQTGRHGPPRVPHRAFNRDTEQARASIEKIAGLAPATLWPGHADQLTGDVATQLRHAAAAT